MLNNKMVMMMMVSNANPCESIEKKKLKKIKRCSVKKKKTIDYKLQFPVFVCLFARDITSFHILTSTIGKLFSIVVM